MKKTFNRNKYYKFFIYLVAIVLVNIAGTNLFFRIDLTANRVYSLSDASKEAVATLYEPLTIKVFFNSNLPAPYNNIERYLHDLLEEYAIAGNRYFNYQFYNVSSRDDDKSSRNQELAGDYGIYPVQIQMIDQDEVKFQKALMGMVLIHGNIIETLPRITSTEGLEFQITSTIRKMNNKISALIGLKEKIGVKLFLSSSLQTVGPYMNLIGLSELPGKIEHTVNKLNEKNYGKLTFTYLNPSTNPAYEDIAEKYNVLTLNWKEFIDQRGEKIPANKGYAGIVVEHGERVEEIQLIKVINLPIFGTQYQLADPDELEDAINETVENVININEEIGYLADHGTHTSGGRGPMSGPNDMESLSNLNQLLLENYSINQVNLKDKEIPEGLSTLIIAGPKETFSKYELYQIDRFLMEGKNLAIFIDSFNEMIPQDQNRMMFRNQGPYYIPLNTGLEKLLAHYGVMVKQSYILDENCFKQNLPQPFGGGQRPIYFAPVIRSESINKDLSFLKNIKGLVLLKPSPLEVKEEKIKDYGLKANRLFSSSSRSWEMSENINLNPISMNPPKDNKAFHSKPLAYILEGSFPSYFANKPIPLKQKKDQGENGTKKEKGKGNIEEPGIDMSRITSAKTTINKGKPAKIFIIGTSEILKNNLLDEEGGTPNSQFIMNIFDYLNDREAFAVMRSKTQRFNPLREVSPYTRTYIKVINIAGLPVMVAIAGLIVWTRRVIRKRTIHEIFRK